MVELRSSWLERAKRELRSIADRHDGDFRSLDIDWGVIKRQLERLETAFTEGNGSEFSAALEMLVSRLDPPGAFRGKIGPGKPKAMPEPIFELLNHVVDKLNYSTPSPSNRDVDEMEDPSGVKVDLTKGETDVC